MVKNDQNMYKKGTMVVQFIFSLIFTTIVGLFAKQIIERKMAEKENMSMDRRQLYSQ